MRNTNQRGFSLIEVVVAVSVLSVGVSALAQLTVVSGRASVAAAQADIIRNVAREKMEQLRALPFTSEDGMLPVTDFASDLAVTPASGAGGAGLGVWSGDSLLSNVAGYCDFLDGSGRWLAAGPAPPRNAVWVRRWSVQPLGGLADALLLQVVVVPAHIVGTSANAAAARSANAAWLVDIRRRSVR